MRFVLLEELNCDLAMIIEHSASRENYVLLHKGITLFIFGTNANKGEFTLFRHYNALVKANKSLVALLTKCFTEIIQE